MRRALIVGVNDYKFSPLFGCVEDAGEMERLLSRNDNGTENFDCEVIVASSKDLDDLDDEDTDLKPLRVTKSKLRKKIREKFRNDDDIDIALFYFAGHGTFSDTDGYLVTQDSEEGDEGFSMKELIDLANNATKIREIVIILDCCYSGNAGNNILTNTSELRKGVSILTSSRENQTSDETRNGGLFTKRVCIALDGGAADIIGNVNIASIYSFVHQLFGANDQRPMFKANLSKLTSLRKCNPAIPIEVLLKIPEYFSKPNFEFPLDPSYEPDLKPKNEKNERIFSHLQRYRAARLLEPIGEEHLFFAAKHSKSCVLTPLGKYYWELAKKGRLA